MRFEVTDDQRLIVDSVRRFVDTQIVPGARERDERELFSRALMLELGKLGIMSMGGPAGLNLVTQTMAIEEIARGDASLAGAVAIHNTLALAPLRDTHSALAETLGSGDLLATFVLGDLTVTIESVEGATRLRGAVPFVWLAHTADTTLVLARSSAGTHLCAVERDAPNFNKHIITGKLGLRALEWADVELDGAPAKDLGVVDFDRHLLCSRITFAAISVGVARAALEAATAYSIERKQFGKSISDFQAIQWMLADMATEIDAARLLVRRAADLADRGLEFRAAAHQAKVYASECATRAAMKAVQIHGGNGFVRELPVERYLRDAKMLEIADKSNDEERAVIARSLLAG